jgi:hypothetical protein
MKHLHWIVAAAGLAAAVPALAAQDATQQPTPPADTHSKVVVAKLDTVQKPLVAEPVIHSATIRAARGVKVEPAAVRAHERYEITQERWVHDEDHDY